jgi:hypothetical protein
MIRDESVAVQRSMRCEQDSHGRLTVARQLAPVGAMGLAARTMTDIRPRPTWWVGVIVAVVKSAARSWSRYWSPSRCRNSRPHVRPPRIACLPHGTPDVDGELRVLPAHFVEPDRARRLPGEHPYPDGVRSGRYLRGGMDNHTASHRAAI